MPRAETAAKNTLLRFCIGKWLQNIFLLLQFAIFARRIYHGAIYLTVY